MGKPSTTTTTPTGRPIYPTAILARAAAQQAGWHLSGSPSWYAITTIGDSTEMVTLRQGFGGYYWTPTAGADPLRAAASEVVYLWRRLNDEGPNTADDLELALDNAIVAMKDTL